MGDGDGVRVDDFAATANDLNASGFKSAFDAIVLFHLHERASSHESLHRKTTWSDCFEARNRASSHRTRYKRSFSQCLGSNGAGVHHRSARSRCHFDDRGAAGPSAGNTQRAGTVIGVSSLSVARLLDLFRERLLAQGYRLQPSVSTPGGASPSTLMADKPVAALALFLNDRGESTEVVLILDRRSP